MAISNDNFESESKMISLMEGNCVEQMTKIPDSCVDLILTDPPYNLGLFMKKRGTNMGKLRNNHFAAASWDLLEFDQWIQEMKLLFKEASRVMKKSGSLIMFMSLIKIESVIKIAEEYGFYYKTTGIWHKTNPMPRNMNLHFVNSTESWLYFVYDDTTGTFNNDGKIIHDFVETATIGLNEKKEGKHPTQKPLSLMRHFISILTNEGDVVLDPFMGSGTTGVACRELNRRFVGIELMPEYFSLAKKRMVLG